MKMKQEQLDIIKAELKDLKSRECFYQKIMKDVDVDSIQTQEDFEKLPFTWL